MNDSRSNNGSWWWMAMVVAVLTIGGASVFVNSVSIRNTPPRTLEDVAGDLARDPRAESRVTAANAIEVLGPRGAQFLPQLLAAINDSDPEVRQAVVRAIVRVGDRTPTTLFALLNAAINDTDNRVRRGAIIALGYCGETAVSVLPEMRQIARRPGEHAILAEATAALVSPSSLTNPEIESLVGALTTAEDGGTRDHVLLALAGTKERALAAMPAIRAIAADETNVSRLAAIRAIGALGPVAKDALPELRRAQQDVRESIVNAAMLAERRVRGAESP